MAKKRPTGVFTAGTYIQECQRCGFELLRKDCLKEWNGLVVCPDCYDPKHEKLQPAKPQDKERGRY